MKEIKKAENAVFNEVSDLRYLEEQLLSAREGLVHMRARAITAENQLRVLRQTMASVESQLASCRKHFEHINLP